MTLLGRAGIGMAWMRGREEETGEEETAEESTPRQLVVLARLPTHAAPARAAD